MSKLIKQKILIHKNGFSLLEALVAIAILTVGLLATVSSFPFSLKVNKGAEQASLASVYGKTKLEQLLIQPYDALAVGTVEVKSRISSDPNNPAHALERETVITLVDGNLQPSVSDLGLKKITVRVFWQNRQGGESSLILSSLVSIK